VYLRLDGMNILQRFFSPDSALWLLSPCHAVGAEEKGSADNPARGPWLLFGTWHVFF